MGFWWASTELKANPREADVLEGFAREEAAKILILLDVVRCPEKLLACESDKLVRRFYGHLDRLIYAQVAEWWFSDLASLRKAVEPLRKAHALEGEMGEYIVPNNLIYGRECKLYADVEAYEDGVPSWSSPLRYASDVSKFMPGVVRLVDAMAACGIFTVAGLKATSEIWGQVEFLEKETLQDAERLTQQLIARLISEGWPRGHATQDHIDALYRLWPLPMYNVDLKEIPVSLEELEAEQDNILGLEF